jgi:hypothetical protein
MEAGTVLVRATQPLGALVVHLLEPQSADGLATWNFLDGSTSVESDFPVMRLPAAAVIHAGLVRPLAEERTLDKPITYESVYGTAPGQGINFLGAPATGGATGSTRNWSPCRRRRWSSDRGR